MGLDAAVDVLDVVGRLGLVELVEAKEGRPSKHEDRGDLLSHGDGTVTM